ncbi:TIGR00730 family Rossman fold protein [Patescibacteria group bacterium]
MEEKNKKIIKPLDEKHLPIKPLTLNEMQDNADDRLDLITNEFKKGFERIMNYPKSVTFFGSARFTEDNPHYQKARTVGSKIVKEGFTIVTGGGPGIMEAGNRGAKEGGGAERSVAFCIELPEGQVVNPYASDCTSFHYFFSRKVMLTFSAEAYVFFPGGFGTLDEFFELVTLIQTHKIPKVPIILVGDDYWGKVNFFIKEYLLDKYETIDAEDMDIYTITEDEDEIIEIIKKAPARDE